MAGHLSELPVQVISAMRLMRAANQGLSSYLEQLLRPLGFTESSFHTLMLLFSSDKGTASPGMLCDLVGQTRANMTRIIDGLITQAYVSRTTDGGDGRRRIIRITAQGKRLVQASLPLLGGPMTLAVAELKPSEIKQLDKLLRRLVTSLESAERQLRANYFTG